MGDVVNILCWLGGDVVGWVEVAWRRCEEVLVGWLGGDARKFYVENYQVVHRRDAVFRAQVAPSNK